MQLAFLLMVKCGVKRSVIGALATDKKNRCFTTWDNSWQRDDFSADCATSFGNSSTLTYDLQLIVNE